MKTLVPVCALLCIEACIASDSGASGVMSNVEIGGYSDRPAVLSGLLRTWVGVTLKQESGATIEGFIPYMTKDQVLPAVGARCTVTYHVAEIDGLVGAHQKKLKQGTVVDDLKCSDPDSVSKDGESPTS